MYNYFMNIFEKLDFPSTFTCQNVEIQRDCLFHTSEYFQKKGLFAEGNFKLCFLDSFLHFRTNKFGFKEKNIVFTKNNQGKKPK
jgi:hypothetical protein